MMLKGNLALTHTTTINGVEYTTVSFFSGEKTIYEKMESMIANDFAAANTVTEHDSEENVAPDMAG